MKKQSAAFGLIVLASLLAVSTARADLRSGRLTGTVVDFAGKPQMGATIWIAPADGSGRAPVQARTKDNGRFDAPSLSPGVYSVRVTLAGYLPTLFRQVRVTANVTTILKFELDSVFSSVAGLRRSPEQPVDSDEWDWVLRTSASTRPVLRWQDDQATANGASRVEVSQLRPRGRLELTSGSLYSGLPSDIPTGPSTAFAYDQALGGTGRLLLAGHFGYDGAPAAGLATTWLPFGALPGGPTTSVVVQQFRVGADGPIFRGIRAYQSGAVELGRRVSVRYSAGYVWMGLQRSSSALEPRVEVAYHISRHWAVKASAGARQARSQAVPEDLETALSQFDGFPALVFDNGRPRIEGAQHAEFGFERISGDRASLSVAVFKDRSRHVPVFVRSLTVSDDGDLPADFLPFPQALDGGSLSSSGARMAYRQKLGDNLEAVLTYAWSGALTLNELASNVALRDALQTRYRHCLAARVSTRIPRFGTRIDAGYKWINHAAVSRVDPSGEIEYQFDPYLNLSVRQPLPSPFPGGKLEAMADIRNLLGQGYSNFGSEDGRIQLLPARRMLRGGVSFQF